MAIQNGGDLRIGGGVLVGNSDAGILGIDSGLLTVVRATVCTTAGDGIQVNNMHSSLTVESLVDNARAGFLAHLGAIQFSFSDITADGLGVVVQQDGAPLSFASNGISLQGATGANDVAFGLGGEVLDVLGLAGPMPEMPAEAFANGGFGAIFGQGGRGEPPSDPF